MKNIYQHIVIGINNLGRIALDEISLAFHYHDLDLLNRTIMRIHINAGENRISFSAPGIEKSGSLPDKIELDSTSFRKKACEDLSDSANEIVESSQFNRRCYLEKFCEGYEDLAEVVRWECERATHPDLMRELAREGYQVKSKKIFIIADIADIASSALILPIVGALKYIFRNERIPDSQWNIIAVAGLEQSPAGKVLSYAFLKEFETLKKSENPFSISLKTPPIDSEIDLVDINPQLYLIDASAHGVASLCEREIAQVISRFMLVETFQTPNSPNPQDRELYFHSFGTGELLFPLADILRGVAYRDIDRFMHLFLEQAEIEDEKKAEFVKNALQDAKKKEPAELPSYNDYIWERTKPGLKDFSNGIELIKEVREHFMTVQKKNDKRVSDIFSEDPLSHEYFRELSELVDRLMDSEFYGRIAAFAFLNSAAVKIKNLLGKIQNWRPQPPSDDEYHEKLVQMKEAIYSNTLFPIAIMVFIFILIPFDKALYDFILWKYEPAETMMIKVTIIVVSLLISCIGAYMQKKLIEGTLKEKFESFVACIQEFHKVHYYKTVKSLMERFYMEMQNLIEGIDEENRCRIRSEIINTVPLQHKLDTFMKKMSGVKFSAPEKFPGFFGAPPMIEPDNPDELDKFLKRFLDRPYKIEEIADFHRKCAVMMKELNKNLPSWKDIYEKRESGIRFFRQLFENRYKSLLKRMEEKNVDIWKIIEEMEDEYFAPPTENLERMSSPLINVGENALLDEADMDISKKLIFMKRKGEHLKVISEFARTREFTIAETDFFGDNMLFLQTLRFQQIYKLPNLDDWKIFEGKIEPALRKNLYIDDRFLNAPDINYSARAAGDN